MRKILSLVLVVAMIFTLVACTSNNENKNLVNSMEDITESTQGTTEKQDPTEEGGNGTIPSTNQGDESNENTNEVITENTEGTEGTEPSTDVGVSDSETKPTEPSKPIKPNTPEETKPHSHNYTSKITKNATCTSDGEKKFTCKCGNGYTEVVKATGHSWGEWKTIKEPTTSSEGTSQRKCNNCSATDNKSIAKLPVVEQKSYYVSHEVAKIERPKTFYVDGVDVLTLARGKNWVQVCDTIKIKVNMSDGGSDFTVKKTIGGTGFTYEKKGNEVWITPDGTTSYIEVLISVKNKNGNNENIVIALYDVYKSNANLSEEQEVEQMLKSYGQQLGMRYTGDGPEILTMQYTTALIYENFKIEAFRTLKQWANNGYTVFTMTVTNYCFDGAAGK